MKLSPHFTLAEMVRSAASERLGLDNAPSDDAVVRLRALCVNVLEPVRAAFGDRGVSITSGYRSPVVNAHVGGAHNSRHLTGEAVDFEIPGVPNIDVARYIAASSLPFDECILEFWQPDEPSAGWVHISYRLPPRNNGRQVLSIARLSGEVRVTRVGLPPRA